MPVATTSRSDPPAPSPPPSVRPVSDVDALRARHAEVYVVRVQLGMLAIGVLSGLYTLVRNGLPLPYDTVVGLGVGTMIIAASILSLRWCAPVRVALAASLAYVPLIAAIMAVSEYPSQISPMLLWPVIAIAYFGTPRLALLVGVVVSVGVLVAGTTFGSWYGDIPVTIAASMILIGTLLVAFVMQQGRRVELSLAASLERDRVALALARGIRLAGDPSEGIREIARTLGSAVGADDAAVLLFEHDVDYVADVATWSADATKVSTELDAASLDATLRHLVASGHGVVMDVAHSRLLATGDGEDQPSLAAAASTAVGVSMRGLLDRFGASSGVLVPLPLGGRAVGAVLLASRLDRDWEGLALPLLEPLAPQLAAGLAQVVLVRDQRDALESLERLDRMRDRLIANVSHELRTPLTSTIGFIETLLRPDVELPEEARAELMEHARDGGLRLLALVEDLLALGSTRPESLELAPQPVHASELVVAALRGIATPPDRHVRVQVDQDVLVHVDRNRLLQVISNLVVNGIRHGTGDIEVRCGAVGAEAAIDVLDDGPGVAPEHVHELFLPFARFSTRSDSTGLGLAICRTIVEAHGGTIDYDRASDGRPRFRLRLPASRANG